MARRNEYREEKQGASGGLIKYAALALVTIIIIFAAKELLLSKAASAPSGTANYVANYPVASPPPTITNGVQEVQVSMQGWQYQPNPIRLKVGVPARLVVDLNTVTGCMRTIEIPDLGVQKYVSQGDNVIAFTPSKAGTFSMHCGMNMGQGIVVVEDANGNVPAGGANLAAAAPAAGGSCGAGGGGCGCGGAR
jgi:hypothetical protein